MIGFAIVLVIVDALRRRNRWSFLFLLTVLAGMEASMLVVKDIVERVRPTLNPAAATLGPRFRADTRRPRQPSTRLRR